MEFELIFFEKRLRGSLQSLAFQVDMFFLLKRKLDFCDHLVFAIINSLRGGVRLFRSSSKWWALLCVLSFTAFLLVLL